MADDLSWCYFAGREDGLSPASSVVYLVASVYA
jgi:hypothetical protein